jgi:hypothetical protein
MNGFSILPQLFFEFIKFAGLLFREIRTCSDIGAKNTVRICGIVKERIKGKMSSSGGAE